MIQNFRKLNPEEIQENAFRLIGKDWMLISAGSINSWNTMTASWGQMGILWNLPVALAYIRPQRYTFEFVEKSEYFTLSFFAEEYRSILNFCGSKSGRDYDKAKETGLKAFETENKNIGFSQAKLILECKKLYADNLDSEKFLQKDLISRNYPKKDFHRFYIGHIENAWVRKKGL